MSKFVILMLAACVHFFVSCEVVEYDSDDAVKEERNVDAATDDSAEPTAKSNNVIEVNIEDDDDKQTDEKLAEQGAAIEVDSAVVQFLNKVSTVSTHQKIKVGEEHKFEQIKVVLRKCFVSAPGDPLCVTAYLDIWEYSPKRAEYSKVFSGWMFSSQPSANTLENSNYDVKIENESDI